MHQRTCSNECRLIITNNVDILQKNNVFLAYLEQNKKAKTYLTPR